MAVVIDVSVVIESAKIKKKQMNYDKHSNHLSPFVHGTNSRIKGKVDAREIVLNFPPWLRILAANALGNVYARATVCHVKK